MPSNGRLAAQHRPVCRFEVDRRRRHNGGCEAHQEGHVPPTDGEAYHRQGNHRHAKGEALHQLVCAVTDYSGV